MDETEHPVRRAFRRAMREGKIAQTAETAHSVFVGFSGGADSSALLVLMAEYCGESGLPLTAVHVHHGIRAEEADRDEMACRSFCTSRDIPLLVRRVNTPALAASEAIGLEDAARKLRYAAFHGCMHDFPDAVFATAHSADDNLETILFHMLRGSGLDGMCGIPPVRGRFIRPLLSVSASDIRDFCHAENISFVEDSTNADTAYTRNYIRHTVVPVLRRIVPVPEVTVSRMAALLRTDAEYLDSAARDALGDFASDTRAPLSILSAMPEALLTRACSVLYVNASGSATDLCAVHQKSLSRMIRRGTCARISLPASLCARIFNGFFSIIPEKECELPSPSDFTAELRKGENRFPEYGFCIFADAENGRDTEKLKNIYKLFICTSIPSATIQGKLWIRFRRSGDSYRFGGMTRIVKKLMNAARIPPEKRDRIPLLCDDAGILWIPGLPVRDPPQHLADSAVRIFYFFEL